MRIKLASAWEALSPGSGEEMAWAKAALAAAPRL